MKCYSFQLTSSELEAVITNLNAPTIYWLREELDKKTIGYLYNSRELSENDISGRIFNDSFEFRYRKKSNGYTCLFTTTGNESWPEQFTACKKQSVEPLSNDSRAYYVKDLKAIVKGESVFKNKDINKILIKEFAFTDDIGGSGYVLYGVI